MKNLLFLLLICMLSLSCQRNSADFKGLGGLNIGENFKSLPLSKNFRHVMEGEFFADSFLLSGIGVVSDLNVSTDNDKIGEVKFFNTEATNMSELNKILESLEEQKIDTSIVNNFPKEIEVRVYRSANQEILFIVSHRKSENLKNSQPKYEFSYIHKDMMEKNLQMTRKMIGLSGN